MAVNDWTPGNATRFPTIRVTKAPAKNNAGWTYFFNDRLLVEAIAGGMLGDAAATAWKAAPMGMTDRLFDISGIFRVLDRGSFDFEVIHIPTVMERDRWHRPPVIPVVCLAGAPDHAPRPSLPAIESTR